jgi:hypothetical protein
VCLRQHYSVLCFRRFHGASVSYLCRNVLTALLLDACNAMCCFCWRRRCVLRQLFELHHRRALSPAAAKAWHGFGVHCILQLQECCVLCPADLACAAVPVSVHSCFGLGLCVSGFPLLRVLQSMALLRKRHMCNSAATLVSDVCSSRIGSCIMLFHILLGY